MTEKTSSLLLGSICFRCESQSVEQTFQKTILDTPSSMTFSATCLYFTNVSKMTPDYLQSSGEKLKAKKLRVSVEKFEKKIKSIGRQSVGVAHVVL